MYIFKTWRVPKKHFDLVTALSSPTLEQFQCKLAVYVGLIMLTSFFDESSTSPHIEGHNYMEDRWMTSSKSIQDCFHFTKIYRNGVLEDKFGFLIQEIILSFQGTLTFSILILSVLDLEWRPVWTMCDLHWSLFYGKIKACTTQVDILIQFWLVTRFVLFMT